MGYLKNSKYYQGIRVNGRVTTRYFGIAYGTLAAMDELIGEEAADREREKAEEDRQLRLYERESREKRGRTSTRWRRSV